MIARTQLEYATLLAKSAPERAKAMASESHATADELGMHGLAERARRVVDETGEGAAPPSPSVIGRSVFRREGDFWTIAYSGPVFRLRDQKGLGHIAKLLRSPGREISALDLAGSGLDAPGDAGEVLDATARKEYKRRLDDLAEELEEAQQNNDEGRAAKTREEIEALTDQLAAAVGLGGRSRRASSTSERARLSVRNAIASTLKAIRAHDEGLWRHLSKAVRTGSLCSYDPETPTEWEF